MTIIQSEIRQLCDFVNALTIASENTGVTVTGAVWTTSGDDSFLISWDEELGGYELEIDNS